MRPTVFVDMDGVLVDFESSFIEFFNRPRFGGQFVSITGHEWARLEKEWPTFWADLEYEDHALDLWRKVLPHHPVLLTAYPDSWPAAAVGKRIWAKRMLPKFGYHPGKSIIVCRREEKQQYAKQGDGTPNILIDDLDRNIAEWTSAGGVGIVYIPSGSAPQRVEQFINAQMEKWQ